MQTITFTTDDNVSQLLQEMTEETHKPTNEVIAESLRFYAQVLKQKKISQRNNVILGALQGAFEVPEDFDEKSEVIELSVTQQEKFVQALLNPTSANAKLLQSAKNYQQKAHG